jgi:hypothetical protein
MMKLCPSYLKSKSWFAICIRFWLGGLFSEFK